MCKVLVYKASESYEIETMMDCRQLNCFIKHCDKLEDLINELLQDECYGIHPEPSIIIRKPPKDFMLKDISWILELYDDWIE